MSLRESSDQFVAIGLLKFMIELSEQVIQSNDRVRGVIDIPNSVKTILDDNMISVPDNVLYTIELNEAHRKSSERRFSNLIRLLSQVRG